jgi:mono/diheme cytochrome c family protein
VRLKAFALAAILAVPVAAAADEAADLYKGKSAGCHGGTGAGDSVVGKKLGVKPLNSAEVQKKADKDLAQIITKGQGKMPAFGGKITDAQVGELVKFIKSLK